MWSKKFWKDAGERAVSTAAQAAILAFGYEVADGGFNAWSADWVTVAGFAVGGVVLSVLKSLVAHNVGDSQSASLVK